MKSIHISTHAKTEVINVTEQVAAMVQESGVAEGLAHLYVPHTTAALILCEDDAELREDIVKVAEEWLADLRPFKHIKKNNPNTEAHVLSAAAGTGVTLAVVNGAPDLGTYQNVLFLEMDGPKETRQIRCQVIGV